MTTLESKSGNNLNLPSYFQLGDTVNLDFKNSKVFKDVGIARISFTEDKVFYDVIVPVGFEMEEFILVNIPSEFITKAEL